MVIMDFGGSCCAPVHKDVLIMEYKGKTSYKSRRKQRTSGWQNNCEPVMVTGQGEVLQDVETGGATQGNRRVRIHSAGNRVQSIPSFELRSAGHYLQRPSSAHTPSTQPLPSLKLRRWRPLSAGGYSSQAFYDKQSSAFRKEYNNNAKSDSLGKTPKPPEDSRGEPEKSKPQREMSVLERNYRKSRLMRFKYPTQMHNWVGPQPNEVPGVLKRSVPRCLQRGNYYGRLPQRQNCHYSPWKSITLVNRHTFASFSLPHPRNKKEQEALTLKAMATPRTSRHTNTDTDDGAVDEPTENILELTTTLQDEEEADKNGTFHYVYDESQSNHEDDNNEEKYSDDEDEKQSVRSRQSDEYEYQDIPGSQSKDDNSSNDEYEEDFSDRESKDSPRKTSGENKKEAYSSDGEIDDETEDTKQSRKESRKESNTSKRDYSDSDIDDETEGAKQTDKRESRRESNISKHGYLDDDIEDETEGAKGSGRRESSISKRDSTGRRDSSHDSVADEVESNTPTPRESPGKRQQSYSDDEVFDEIDETERENDKKSYGGKQEKYSDAESVGDDEENDRKSIASRNSRKSSAKTRSPKRSIRSHGSSDSETEAGEYSKTMRQESIASRKSSARSRNDSVLSRQNSVLSNRRESLNSPKDSARSKQESVISRNNSIISDRRESKTSVRSRQASVSGSRTSIASPGKGSYASPRNSASMRHGSVSSGRNSVASNRRDSETSPVGSARYRPASASSRKNSVTSSRKGSVSSPKSHISDKVFSDRKASVDSEIEEDEVEGERYVETDVREELPYRQKGEDESPRSFGVKSDAGLSHKDTEPEAIGEPGNHESDKKKVSWKTSDLEQSLRPTVSDLGTDSEEDSPMARANMFI